VAEKRPAVGKDSTRAMSTVKKRGNTNGVQKKLDQEGRKNTTGGRVFHERREKDLGINMLRGGEKARQN